jgi:protein arginine kinase activator
MLCQNCQKNVAKIHVTELQADGSNEKAAGAQGFQEQHLCEVCAESLDLPSMPSAKKTTQEIWKLLQIAAQQTRKKSGPACPDCGMTLDEFRKKGRLGCARDYEVFKAHVLEILERVHGARRHVGRVPGGAVTEDGGQHRLIELRRELENAIREEAYERAAHLRDEIKALEETNGS